jgi:hypothetical protein
MEQRRLRLGDILDDYCPRERRVTNHAVVAMVEEDVKQTRCTTCDAEHVYKGGKGPRRRKKDAGTALYQEVLAGMPETLEAAPVARPVPSPVVEPPEPEPVAQVRELDEPAGPEASVEAEEPADRAGDDGPFHRRLIRATLPRPEGQKETRQAPDFTIRQNGARGGHAFRGGQKMRGPGGNGNRPGGHGRGPGGGRQGRFGGGNAPGGGQGRPGRPGFGNRGRKR